MRVSKLVDHATSVTSLVGTAIGKTPSRSSPIGDDRELSSAVVPGRIRSSDRRVFFVIGCRGQRLNIATTRISVSKNRLVYDATSKARGAAAEFGGATGSSRGATGLLSGATGLS